MNELLEAFNLDEALRSFKEPDIRSACSKLLQVLGYTCLNDQDFNDDSVENFIYFATPKKTYFSTQERTYLSQISILNYMGEATQSNLFEAGYDSKKIIFILCELNCTKSSRSETAYYITQILNKLFDDYILVVYIHKEKIAFCSCNDMGNVHISEWFETQKPTLAELLIILQLSPVYMTGVKNIEEFYAELSYALSREYLKHPESYEYTAYECFPPIIDDVYIDISKEVVKEYALKNRNYYYNLYGDDYVFAEDKMIEIEDSDKDWTLLELEGFVYPEKQGELDIECFYDSSKNKEHEPLDCASISEEILSDPVKLLEYLESL